MNNTLSTDLARSRRVQIAQRFDRLRAVLADVDRTRPDQADQIYEACCTALDEMTRRVAEADLMEERRGR